MLRISVALLLAGATNSLSPSVSVAQIDLDPVEINIPYAHYYGTGTYGIPGQRVYSLALRGKFPLGQFDPDRIGFNIRASSMVAWQRIEAAGTDKTTFPFFTIVPGLGLDIPLSRRVVLQPFVDAGIGRDVDYGAWLAIGTVGTGLEWVFPVKRFELGIEPAAGYSRSFSSDPLYEDGMFAAFLMLDIRHPLGLRVLGEQGDLGFYSLFSNFWGDTDLDANTSETVEIERQLELGLSFGLNPRPKIWILRVPRLSIGYRFGRDFKGLRISLSERRLRLPPR